MKGVQHSLFQWSVLCVFFFCVVFCVVVAVCDLVHNVESTFLFFKLITVSGNTLTHTAIIFTYIYTYIHRYRSVPINRAAI